MTITIKTDFINEEEIKKSRFICHLKRISSEEEARDFIAKIKKTMTLIGRTMKSRESKKQLTGKRKESLPIASQTLAETPGLFLIQ